MSLGEWTSLCVAGGDETQRYFGNTHQNLKCWHTFGLYCTNFILCMGEGRGVGIHENLDIRILIEAYFMTLKLELYNYTKIDIYIII